jgi:hypothetical protein
LHLRGIHYPVNSDSDITETLLLATVPYNSGRKNEKTDSNSPEIVARNGMEGDS